VLEDNQNIMNLNFLKEVAECRELNHLAQINNKLPRVYASTVSKLHNILKRCSAAASAYQKEPCILVRFIDWYRAFDEYNKYISFIGQGLHSMDSFMRREIGYHFAGRYGSAFTSANSTKQFQFLHPVKI
jgi:hypothetical protein